jgi:hypothetical protein
LTFFKQTAVSNEHDVPADKINIDNISTKSGSKKGDGFVCDIAAVQFQATVDGQSFQKNYIAKFSPEGHREEMMKQVNKNS